MSTHQKNIRSASVKDEQGNTLELKFDPPVSTWEASHRIQQYYRERKAAQ